MTTVALVTSRQASALPGTARLRQALARCGCASQELAWNAQGVDWGSVALAVPRGTFADAAELEPFLAWAQRVPRLLNPAPVLKWSLHRGCQRQLEARGVPTVPTVWLSRGAPPPGLAALLEKEGWSEAVLRPCIAAGAPQARRFSLAEVEPAQAALRTLLEQGDAMVQPYLRAVETARERSLVFLDGAFSHAVRREPQLSTGRHAGSIARADEDELWVARLALAAVDAPLLYAQVDVVRDDDGEVRLLDLELVSPALFLEEHPPAIDAFAKAMARQAQAFTRSG